MKKINKTVCSDVALEELLVELQLHGREAEELESDSDVSAEEYSSDAEVETMCQQEPCIREFRSGERYKISKGPSPFSLFGIAKRRARERSEYAAVAVQTLVVPQGGRYEFTQKDLDKYRMKRKKRVRDVCPNWEDVVEERSNEPERVGFRSLGLGRRRT